MCDYTLQNNEEVKAHVVQRIKLDKNECTCLLHNNNIANEPTIFLSHERQTTKQ